MGKPFLTYAQQLDNLTKQKGLIINDKPKAENTLHLSSLIYLPLAKVCSLIDRPKQNLANHLSHQKYSF